VLLVTLVVAAMCYKYWKSYQINQHKTNAMKEYKVKGMMCNHCKANVERGLAAVPGVDSVTVDLARGTALVEGQADEQAIIDKIGELGYEYEP